MSATICRQFVNAATEQEVTELVDSFGRKHIVQVSIHDPSATEILATEMSAMNTREATFRQSLINKGYNPDEYVKNPNDCGCSS